MSRIWQWLFPGADVGSPPEGPVVVLVEPDRTYQWCACGKTSTSPFCDGGGQDSPCRPHVVSARQAEYLYFCGCARTTTPPFCDGRSHHG